MEWPDVLLQSHVGHSKVVNATHTVAAHGSQERPVAIIERNEIVAAGGVDIWPDLDANAVAGCFLIVYEFC
ncbi:MAG: hypothetical protein R3330_08840, partial [Saprospiraceae bacterium]|nr:hypothetical protein [Saprospiraceae bacterium]